MKYRANGTMRLLGKQYYNRMMNQEQYDQLQEIKAAYINEHQYDFGAMMIDAYMLGYIMGQRAERARKRGRK